MKINMKPIFFSDQNEFRNWLEKNHQKESELFVGFYKIASGKPSMTWSQSVDQALCFGWIDGIRKSIDSESYCIRFTPRRAGSTWSLINIKKVEELKKSGLMTPEGIKAFKLKDEKKSQIYSYEKDSFRLGISYEKQFKENKSAWDFFLKQSPSYKKNVIYWIMSAKQEKTRESRLEKLIAQSAQQKKLT